MLRNILRRSGTPGIKSEARLVGYTGDKSGRLWYDLIEVTIIIKEG